jgi:hypothetical protein
MRSVLLCNPIAVHGKDVVSGVRRKPLWSVGGDCNLNDALDSKMVFQRPGLVSISPDLEGNDRSPPLGVEGT